MKNNSFRPFFLLCSLFIVAFLLNFFWESLHALFLYTCCTSLLAFDFVKLIFIASLGDGMYIVLMYLLVALFFKSLYWIFNLKKNNLFIFSLLGILLAIFIEIKGVYFLEKWSYSSLMPTLFGLGLSPLIELTLTGLLTLFVVLKLMK